MPDDDLLELVSRYADGDLDAAELAAVEEGLRASPEARGFLDDIERLRRHFRYETAPEMPDLVPGVVASLPRRRSVPAWVAVAAMFAVGALAGAAFVGFTRDRGLPPAAASIGSRVLEAQHAVQTLRATLTVTEQGWHADVPVRTYRGTLAYEAPERIAVVLEDTTSYPDGSWVPNDTESVVDDGITWTSGPVGCPRESLPLCTPSEPRVSMVVGRGPFPDAAPAPLDVVVPAASFDGSGEVKIIGHQAVDGVAAVGVGVTVAQARPLIDGLLRVGNWRPLHPTDEVELWLGDEALVPLALTVRVSSDPDRELWAVRQGLDDRPGAVVLQARWSDLVVNGGPVGTFPEPPSVVAMDAGFVDGPVDGPRASHLPPGMALHRRGTAGDVSSVAWSDGRAWIRMSWTTAWQGSRLFGDVGLPVRAVATEAGPVYVDEAGRRVAVHGGSIDVLITGSVPVTDLVSVAGGLDVTALPVPPSWEEAGTASLAEAHDALPGLLAPSGEGFSPPAVAVRDGVVTLGYAGPGTRGFTVVATAGALAPPSTGDVVGVTVRGLNGRWVPSTGTLEWVEEGVVISMSSRTLSRAELLAIADGMTSG